jgi:hypothetical protein
MRRRRERATTTLTMSSCMCLVLRRVLGTLVEPIYSARTVFLYTALSREIAMSPCASFVFPRWVFQVPEFVFGVSPTPRALCLCFLVSSS